MVSKLYGSTTIAITIRSETACGFHKLISGNDQGERTVLQHVNQSEQMLRKE